MTAPDAPLVFVHVPRTAGSTFNAILAQCYGPDVFHVDPYDIHNSLATYRRDPTSWRVASGHIGAESVPGRRVTILREPLERVVSEYLYARERPRHHEHEHANAMSLGEYVGRGLVTGVDNQAVRQLSGPADVSMGPGDFRFVPFGECTDEMLARAKRNLARFDVIGITEDLPAFVSECADRFGWGEQAVPHLNTTASALIPSPAQTRLILEQNHLDVALYHFARTELCPRSTVS